MAKQLASSRRCHWSRWPTTFWLLILGIFLALSLTTTQAFSVQSKEGQQKQKTEKPPEIQQMYDGSGSGNKMIHDPSGESKVETKSKGGGGITLGEILGVFSLICCLLYCIGIGWKIVKVFKGTYVAEEPVFLKYK